MLEMTLLLLLIALVALWLDGRRVQEIAVARCREACETAGVQFLDDVAAFSRVGLMRDTEGVLKLRRIYAFEYSTSLGDRRSGSITMLGHTPAAIVLEGRTIFDTNPYY